MENGEFWSKDMNSFNHYAYGAVGDWIYGVAAGICPVEVSRNAIHLPLKEVGDELLFLVKRSIDTVVDFADTYGYDIKINEELAYTLLLRTKYPSWLYPVTKGATTIWEHWDGINSS